MTTIFDQLQPASFEGIEFPVKTLRVAGGIRDHIHEYPHTPGGAPEKLGRKLYEFHVTADFTAGLIEPRYQFLWPSNLAQLRTLFETQTTGTLLVPTIGPIQAYCVAWEQTQTAANRSGEEVQMSFREDASDTFLIDDAISVNLGSMQSKLDNFNFQASSFPTVSIFSAIDALCSSVLAFNDQFELYGALVTSKIDGLVSTLREADHDVVELNDPPNWQLLAALHDLWQSAAQLQKDIQQQNDFLRTFTTPVRMGVGQVAVALFGDSAKGVDLMRLNVLPDPLAIEPGTLIRYYQAA